MFSTSIRAQSQTVVSTVMKVEFYSRQIIVTKWLSDARKDVTLWSTTFRRNVVSFISNSKQSTKEINE